MIRVITFKHVLKSVFKRYKQNIDSLIKALALASVAWDIVMVGHWMGKSNTFPGDPADLKIKHVLLSSEPVAYTKTSLTLYNSMATDFQRPKWWVTLGKIDA